MRTLQSILMMLILGMVFVISVWTQPVLADEHDNQTDDKVWSFEKDEIGSIPKGWKVAETRGNEKTAIWQVISDGAKSQKAVAITETENKGNTYNLLIAEEIHCRDLEVSVMVKAMTGEEDQGGGPIWRAKDANNYYIARWNPLENNFRVYYVKDGSRKQLASAKTNLDPKKWHEIEIEHVGNKIVAKLDDQKVIEVEDSTFTEGGMVGLWTKADAATAFDVFEIETENGDVTISRKDELFEVAFSAMQAKADELGIKGVAMAALLEDTSTLNWKMSAQIMGKVENPHGKKPGWNIIAMVGSKIGETMLTHAPSGHSPRPLMHGEVGFANAENPLNGEGAEFLDLGGAYCVCAFGGGSHQKDYIIACAGTQAMKKAYQQ